MFATIIKQAITPPVLRLCAIAAMAMTMVPTTSCKTVDRRGRDTELNSTVTYEKGDTFNSKEFKTVLLLPRPKEPTKENQRKYIYLFRCPVNMRIQTAHNPTSALANCTAVETHVAFKSLTYIMRPYLDQLGFPAEPYGAQSMEGLLKSGFFIGGDDTSTIFQGGDLTNAKTLMTVLHTIFWHMMERGDIYPESDNDKVMALLTAKFGKDKDGYLKQVYVPRADLIGHFGCSVFHMEETAYQIAKDASCKNSRERVTLPVATAGRSYSTTGEEK